MAYYRLESDFKEVNTVIDTLTRNNFKRMPYLMDPNVIRYLNCVAEYSENNKVSLFEIFNHEITTKGYEIATVIPGIWETIFEIERPQNIKIKRTECTFFFTNIEDCKKYKQYPGMEVAKICEVNIIQQYDIFEGDMNWLNTIDENTATTVDTKIAAEHFWNGDMTSKPMKEVLFQGKYKLVPLP